MTLRQEEFLKFYLDRNSKSYMNGKLSALSAGYKDGPNLGTRVKEILDCDAVKAALELHRRKEEKRFLKTREEAVIEARKNYEDAPSPTIKKWWFEMWVKLSGWMVEKSEVKSEVRVEEQQNMIADEVRKMLANAG